MFMKNLIKKIASVVVLLLISFFIWMNLTPGHFQRSTCCGGCGYLTQNESEALKSDQHCAVIDCKMISTYQSLACVALQRLDYNK